jgi:hypothetical protein
MGNKAFHPFLFSRSGSRFLRFFEPVMHQKKNITLTQRCFSAYFYSGIMATS